jgi:exodeoxyribonuclease VII small subunit
MERKTNYSEALAELELIVDQIENSEISVDDLSQKVERASELITICKSILEKTEKDVQGILKSLEKKMGSEN